MGNDSLVRADGEPALADVVVLATRKPTHTVETAAYALEPAGPHVVVKELPTDAMHACLLRGEVPALVVRVRLKARDVMHESSTV